VTGKLQETSVRLRVRLNLLTKQHISLDFKILDNIMDQIPEEIRDKLVARGYVDRDRLPNTDKNIDRWSLVKADCDLDGGQLSLLMNILFPVGK
jgi:hypothetical protein